MKVLDLPSCQVLKAFKISEYALSCVALLSPALLVLGCWDKHLYVFNLIYGSVVKRYADAHYDSISCVQVEQESLRGGLLAADRAATTS